MREQATSLQRQTGVAIWRQIADQLRSEIAQNANFPSGRLPTEAELATRFDVNRHTIRAAIAALASEGIVTSRRGMGTFIERRERYIYPIGPRTRFSAGLDGQASDTRTRIVSTSQETASEIVATELGITERHSVIRVNTVGEADNMTLTCSTHWFDAARFPGIDRWIAETGSITKALRQFGVDDYRRGKTRIDAAHASVEDIRLLGLVPGAMLLVTTYVNMDSDDLPFQFSTTRFAADRVSLCV